MWQASQQSRSQKSLAASPLALRGGFATKKLLRATESCQLRRLHQQVSVWTGWPHCGAFASFPKKLTNARQLPSRGNEHACNWVSRYSARLQVVPHFSSGIVERAKRERTWKSPHLRKGNTHVGWFSRALAFCSLYYPWKIRDYSPVVYWLVCDDKCTGPLTNTRSNMVLRSKLSKSHLGTHAFRLKLLQRHKTKAYFRS